VYRQARGVAGCGGDRPIRRRPMRTCSAATDSRQARCNGAGADRPM